MEKTSSPAAVSLKNILVATDFSETSKAALLYALSLVRHYDATLYLVHVVRPDPLRRGNGETVRAAVDEAWREGQRLTTDLLVSGHLRGISHKLLVRQGEIWEGMAPLVQENNIDLIVVGTRGRTGLAKVLLGSVAERIFRRATCPVLTVGPKSPGPSAQEPGIRRILYATDFTPQSLHAFGHALSLAQHYQAHLILLHVVHELTADATPQKGRALDDAKKRLRDLVPADTGLSFEPEFVVGFGTPGTRILDVAAEKVPELIVLGVTHPPNAARGGRRWTTASEVIVQAICPVLTVRGGAE
ncbi:MAG: universal stress protein [Acidobacteriia bacterium]|nr:universal stress protein [Terriglobia bacterium]